MTITGKWKITEAEFGGRKLPSKDFENLVLELDLTSYQLIEQKVIDSGIVELVGDTEPAGLTVTGLYGPNKGRTFHCIYKIEGDQMIMCYNLGGDSRPASFETFENTLLYLVRYKRVGHTQFTLFSLPVDNNC
jgi:uncharacterized protein (TIGR03067 family)